MLNSYAHQFNFGEQGNMADIVLDEYEKSLFLTQAQDELVVSLYNGKNLGGDSFENSEELRRYLSDLVKDKEYTVDDASEFVQIDSKSLFFTLPQDLWFITYESVNLVNDGRCGDNRWVEVVPVTQDEYHKIKKNPFRGTTSRRALRLDVSGRQVEIVSEQAVSKYYLRYIKHTQPIILEDLRGTGISGVLQIKGKTGPMECELHELLHYQILERAVRMAVQAKGLSGVRNKE